MTLRDKLKFWILLSSYIDMVVRDTSPLSLPDAIADSLSYVKAFGGTEHVAENYIDSVTVDGKCEQRNLPDNYIQRDYIYMLDGSYLLTDIVPTYDGHIEVDFQTTSLPSYSSNFGGRADTTQGSGLNLGYVSSKFVLDAFSSSRYTSNVTPVANTRYKFTFNNKVATLESGGTTLFTNTFTGENANGAALAINALNNNGTVVNNLAGIYLYSFKVWNGQGELVADYVPAIQKGTVPVVGFYDTVSGTFKTATAGTFAAGPETMPTTDAPMDIWCNNGVLKVNLNLYWTEYHGKQLSQVDGITLSTNAGVNVSGMVDCRTIKSFKITTASPQGNFRIFKYRADDTFINANSTANIGDIVTLEDNVAFFRIQYNYTNTGTNTENILIYNSAYSLNAIYTDGTAEVLTDDVGNTASVANVLSCDNFKDTQEILTGAITRNVGIKVLDGTETFTFSTIGNVCVFPQSVFQNILEDGEVLCSHLTYTNTVPGVSDRENKIFWGLSSGFEKLFLGFNNAELNSESKIRQYLAQQYANGTPVIIVYPLATATTESVAGQVLTKTPVTQTAGSLTTNITTVATDHTVPTPTQPLDINCNNGVLKLSPNLFDKNNTLSDGRIWTTATGSQSNLSGYYGVNPIKVKGGHTYTRSGSHGVANYFLLDDNTSFLVQDNSATITVPDNAVMWYFNNTTSTDRNTAMVVEGSSLPSEYMPYGEIYTDGTVETINVHGKNLFDAQNVEIEESKAISTNGSLVSNLGVDTCASYIKVSPNTTYTISGDKLGNPSGDGGSVYYFRLATYDSNKQFLARSNDSETVTNEYTFTTGANVEYIRFHYVKTGNIDTFQLEKGATATTYEPYYNGGTATTEMLLKVGNYQDVQSIIDGVVTRNIGVKVLDGTENWSWNGSSSWRARLNIPTVETATSSMPALLCNMFTASSWNGVSATTPLISINSGGLTINFTVGWNANITTLTDWTQWLADQYANGTPVIVIYPLATPTTESVAGQTLQVQAGDNVLEITQASMSGLELEAKYKKSAQ